MFWRCVVSTSYLRNWPKSSAFMFYPILNFLASGTVSIVHPVISNAFCDPHIERIRVMPFLALSLCLLLGHTNPTALFSNLKKNIEKRVILSKVLTLSWCFLNNVSVLICCWVNDKRHEKFGVCIKYDCIFIGSNVFTTDNLSLLSRRRKIKHFLEMEPGFWSWWHWGTVLYLSAITLKHYRSWSASCARIWQFVTSFFCEIGTFFTISKNWDSHKILVAKIHSLINYPKVELGISCLLNASVSINWYRFSRSLNHASSILWMNQNTENATFFVECSCDLFGHERRKGLRHQRSLRFLDPKHEEKRKELIALKRKNRNYQLKRAFIFYHGHTFVLLLMRELWWYIQTIEELG